MTILRRITKKDCYPTDNINAHHSLQRMQTCLSEWTFGDSREVQRDLVNIAVKRLRMYKTFDDLVVCFQVVRAKLSHTSYTEFQKRRFFLIKLQLTQQNTRI